MTLTEHLQEAARHLSTAHALAIEPHVKKAVANAATIVNCAVHLQLSGQCDGRDGRHGKHGTGASSPQPSPPPEEREKIT